MKDSIHLKPDACKLLHSRLSDIYPEEYPNPPILTIQTGLLMHGTLPVAVFKQCLNVNTFLVTNLNFSPVFPPRARALEGAQKERMYR